MVVPEKLELLCVMIHGRIKWALIRSGVLVGALVLGVVSYGPSLNSVGIDTAGSLRGMSSSGG